MVGLFPKISVPDWLLHCVTNRRAHDASSVVKTPIDNGKLAKQIARLQAIVIKIFLIPFLFKSLSIIPLAPGLN